MRCWLKACGLERGAAASATTAGLGPAAADGCLCADCRDAGCWSIHTIHPSQGCWARVWRLPWRSLVVRVLNQPHQPHHHQSVLHLRSIVSSRACSASGYEHCRHPSRLVEARPSRPIDTPARICLTSRIGQYEKQRENQTQNEESKRQVTSDMTAECVALQSR
jgi:hypothetical protein